MTPYRDRREAGEYDPPKPKAPKVEKPKAEPKAEAKKDEDAEA